MAALMITTLSGRWWWIFSRFFYWHIKPKLFSPLLSPILVNIPRRYGMIMAWWKVFKKESDDVLSVLGNSYFTAFLLAPDNSWQKDNNFLMFALASLFYKPAWCQRVDVELWIPLSTLRCFYCGSFEKKTKKLCVVCCYCIHSLSH